MRADAAADAEHRLDEERRLEQPPLQEMRRGVEVPDVVALDLEARFVVPAAFQDGGDVAERVLEDALVRPGEIGLLPVVLELLVAPEHLVQAEVHRAHVERGDFGLELQRRLQALLDAHRRRAAGGEVEHHVARRADLGAELAEELRILRRAAVLRVARVQVHDRRARLRRAERRFGDLVGSNGKVRRHTRRVDRAGHGTGNDDFALRCCHSCELPGREHGRAHSRRIRGAESAVKIEIRRVEPGDYKAVQQIHAQPKAVWGTLQLPFPSEELWRKRLLESGDEVHSLVASVDGKLVGMAALINAKQARRRHVASIGMAVHDEWHSRGVGTALMKALIDLADNWLKLERLELTVYTDNEPALRLYKKLGFEIEGTHRKYAFRDGAYVDSYCMARVR